MTSQETLKYCKEYLNERVLLANKITRSKSHKKIKGARKKLKGGGVVISPPSSYDVVDSLLAMIKLQIILYLRLDFDTKEFLDWVQGVHPEEYKKFLGTIREETCRDVIGIIEKNRLFYRSIEVKDWFFHSGFLKRTNHLLEYRFEKFPNTNPYDEAVMDLKQKFIVQATTEIKTLGMENFMYGEKNTTDLLVDEELHDFYKSVIIVNRAIKLAVATCGDKEYKKRGKYVSTMIHKLEFIIKEYIFYMDRFTKKVLKKTAEEFLEKQIGKKYAWMIKKSCALENIPYEWACRNEWESYLKYLKELSPKKFKQEENYIRGL